MLHMGRTDPSLHVAYGELIPVCMLNSAGGGATDPMLHMEGGIC